LELVQLAQIESECLDCGKHCKKLSRTGRCTLCGIKYAQTDNKKTAIVRTFFKDKDLETTIRIMNFLIEQEKLTPF
jgi:hypothetical protein